MIYSSDAARENLTLTEADLFACRPISGEGGRVLRAFCPFHGGDHQRSLRVEVETGRFTCFACGAWGYTEEARQRWGQERHRESEGWRSQGAGGKRPLLTGRPSPNLGVTQRNKGYRPPASRPSATEGPGDCQQRQADPAHPTSTRASALARVDLAPLLRAYREALPGSLGEEYLRQRGISLSIARATGVGYVAPGAWPHKNRDWKWGRLVFPHAIPDGDLVNLYGRAVGAAEKVPKEKRHDHLPGGKGYFNAAALRGGEGPLFVCEGAFDALSLMAAGHPRVVASFGVHGWRWEWARGVREIVLALDADPAGQLSWRMLARQAVLRGKRVAFLPPEAYGGHKDLNEAWVAGVLTVGEWPALEAADVEESAVPEAFQDDLWEERAAFPGV